MKKIIFLLIFSLLNSFNLYSADEEVEEVQEELWTNIKHDNGEYTYS